MNTPDEDELWRSIVDNYGDRPVLDEESAPDDLAGAGGSASPEGPSRSPLLPGPEPSRPVEPQRPTGFVPFDGSSLESSADQAEPDDDTASVAEDPTHRFVPPDPPLPKMDGRRWLAWLAVLGSPVAFVLAAVLNVNLQGIVAAALALCFVGGVLWLVASMSRDPRDPFDDGARV